MTYIDKGHTVFCRNWYSETDRFIGTFDSYDKALQCLEKERQIVKQKGFKVVNESENRFEVERKNFTAFGTDKYYIRISKNVSR